MKLMNKAIERKLVQATELSGKINNGESPMIDSLDRQCAVKYFNPLGNETWLILDGYECDGDWIMFGLCYITDWEWGYVSLRELESVKLPYGMGIEREMYSKFSTIREMARQLGYCE